MSKREFIQRFNLIIAKVRKHPSTFQEIADMLTYESEKEGYIYTISKRTFIRDLEEIRSLYNIDIKYNFSKRVYEIDSEQSEVKDRILEAFDIFNTLKIGESLANFIHFEKRKPHGTDNLYGLLHAIKNQFEVTFIHHKYWEEVLSQRRVEPYLLKESKNRWYVIAKDLNDNRVKTFALDRINNLEITRKKFRNSTNFDATEYFRHSFGIISPVEGQKIEEIILSFTPFQGKYIKSLPLHESQVILIDDAKELRIKLYIYITQDFIKEILSHGWEVKIIEPQSLIEKIKTIHHDAFNQYHSFT